MSECDSIASSPVLIENPLLLEQKNTDEDYQVKRQKVTRKSTPATRRQLKRTAPANEKENQIHEDRTTLKEETTTTLKEQLSPLRPATKPHFAKPISPYQFNPYSSRSSKSPYQRFSLTEKKQSVPATLNTFSGETQEVPLSQTQTQHLDLSQGSTSTAVQRPLYRLTLLPSPFLSYFKGSGIYYHNTAEEFTITRNFFSTNGRMPRNLKDSKGKVIFNIMWIGSQHAVIRVKSPGSEQKNSFNRYLLSTKSKTNSTLVKHRNGPPTILKPNSNIEVPLEDGDQIGIIFRKNEILLGFEFHDLANEAPINLSVLFATPLAHPLLGGLELNDYRTERELLWKSIFKWKWNSKVNIHFDFATADSFREVLTSGRSSVLHYSGEGGEGFLAFEDDCGGLQTVDVLSLKGAIQAAMPFESSSGSVSRSPLQLVFVSACESESVSNAFLSAGVPHIVAVRSDCSIADDAASKFSAVFYQNLFKGCTVQKSFDQARIAVKSHSKLQNPQEEANMFILLPKETTHEVSLFPIQSLLDELPEQDRPLLPLLGSVRANLPSEPENCLHRTLSMFQINLSLLRDNRRLITVCGEAGAGNTVFAVSLCHFLADRKVFDPIHFVDLRSIVTVQQLAGELNQLLRLNGIQQESKEAASPTLQERSLLILDGIDHLLVSDNEVIALLELIEQLCAGLHRLSILVTARQSLSSRFSSLQSSSSSSSLSSSVSPLQSVSEKVFSLPPLTNEETVTLLLRRSPRSLQLEDFPSAIREQLSVVDGPLFPHQQRELLLASDELLRQLNGNCSSILSFAAQLANRKLYEIQEKSLFQARVSN